MQPLGRNTIYICNLILSRLAGKVYSFFQRFHGLTMSKYYETAKIGGLTLSLSVTFTSIIPREASHPRSEIIFFFEIHIAREMYLNVRGPLPSPCTAFSQSLSVNSLRLHHTARHALAGRNNEA